MAGDSHLAEEGWWETVAWDGSAEEGQSPGTARLRRDSRLGRLGCGGMVGGCRQLRRDGG